ncbi:Fe-S protein assembly chaperone HscA [Brucella melitensis]|uniref:Uncharacterized protein n=5 Tax=Brucella TaxID=234 RepID=Q2YRQ1_BRUA2|nr:hypothetical protein BR1155 [Brucella suis 1330]AAX74500.1 hypothetical protein BruAb1_1161 [Brucella abortus bv. 1 str. 9-941]ACU48141.1 hypothetical protein BMI_I1166 [Brucella microti CCM 4915]AEK54470.1 hypothetical protein BPI_I1201 [Brucella pinnipedialis B2/94]AEU06161.1 hypothetical protein BSVBI22_A1151 [Brucella suis VBI22]AHN46781.1 hypothetical protein BSS2_I1124 [Brucella suis bv. 1 str. S2]AUS54173.1 Fe-S protein assembly chaperone HscA [Brucella melitensis]AUS57324.1 Fe-S p
MMLACMEKPDNTVVSVRAFLGKRPGDRKTKVRKAYDGKF